SFYLDCVGFAAALVNRLLLKTSSPSKGQVRFWDRAIVPVSMIADRLFGSVFGKTIVMVWKKP
ncbi:MAG: methyltransferase type 12, partial [Hyphomicrobiales bacterium]|nr:methyltransferase type 12 [Hyphomicrobiales bacterium]